jgi:hypothetical protein
VIEGLTALQKRFAAISDNRQMLGQIAELARKEAKDLVPRKTGNLGRSIRLGTVTETSAQIIAGGKDGIGYARMVEFGTRAHTIVAKPGRSKRNPKYAHSLAWGGARRLSGSQSSGGSPTNFAMSVHHPGSRAKPFLVPGAKKAVEKAGLADRVITAWNEAS